MNHKLFRSNPGFTIVELLIVIVIIGILATIVVVSGAGYIKKSADTTVQSNLQSAVTKLRNNKSKNGGYPTTQTALNGLLKSNSDVALTMVAANNTQFCLKATSWKYADIFYYMGQNSTKPSPTDCTSQVAIEDGGGGDGGGDDGGGGSGGGGGPQNAIVSSPATYDFGTISSGFPQHTFTLTNTSSSPVTIYTVNGSGPQGLWFTFWSISCPGSYSNFSITLQAGQSCSYGAGFFNYQNSTNPTSTVPGSKSGYLILYEQAPGGGSSKSYHILEMTGTISS